MNTKPSKMGEIHLPLPTTTPDPNRNSLGWYLIKSCDRSTDVGGKGFFLLIPKLADELFHRNLGEHFVLREGQLPSELNGRDIEEATVGLVKCREKRGGHGY